VAFALGGAHATWDPAPSAGGGVPMRLAACVDSNMLASAGGGNV